jgi:hypothetical protein
MSLLVTFVCGSRAPVLELYFQTAAELVEIDLRPIDAEFAANPLSHGGTYPLFFGFHCCVLSNADWFFKLNLS